MKRVQRDKTENKMGRERNDTGDATSSDLSDAIDTMRARPQFNSQDSALLDRFSSPLKNTPFSFQLSFYNWSLPDANLLSVASYTHHQLQQQQKEKTLFALKQTR